MLLFIDTETTGKWDFRHDSDWPHQPRMVQLACYLTDDDGQFEAANQWVVKPDGWTIEPSAQALHHLSMDYCWSFGHHIRDVMLDLNKMLQRTDADGFAQGRIIAHNMRFDTNIILREMRLTNTPPEPFGMLRPFCTMLALTPLIKLPSRRTGASADEYKWPTLQEAWQFCFPDRGYDTQKAHTAMGDVLTCHQIFMHGRKQGWWR